MAPGMGVALPVALTLDHWYVSATEPGPHLPGEAVNVEPTRAVPTILGWLLVSCPLRVAEVLAARVADVA